MRSLVETVKKMSVRTRAAHNKIDFLDHQLVDPMCQKIIDKMSSVDIRRLGITGTDAASDPYHFQEKLNRVVIEGNDDYRLVLFFIKKGTIMPLHDHPNMSVYFKLMFGKLRYHQFDKLEDKFKYNDFSNDEYAELLETKKKIDVVKQRERFVTNEDFLLVRPSEGNMHTFTAEEDSCFFDICLPNYTEDSLRRITYFNEISDSLTDCNPTECRAQVEFHATPPVLPNGMVVADLDYIGETGDHHQYF